MISKNVNIRLSSAANVLSGVLFEFYRELDLKSRNLLKELKRYLKFHIQFLIQFNYTKANIKNHLMEKAAHFFGFDFHEDEKPKKRKRVGKTINRFKQRLNERLTTDHKAPKKRRTGKKIEKKAGNFYRAPE